MARHRPPRCGAAEARRRARRLLASVAGGALAAALPAWQALVSDSSPASPFAPVTLGGDLERHPGTTVERLVPEVHERPVDDLVKAFDIADANAVRRAALASARAGGATNVFVGPNGTFVQPAQGRLTSAAGPRWGGQHFGTDIANAIGTPIVAVTDGVVVEAGPASGFGLWVRIAHPGGWSSVYGHIDRSLVQAGQRVRAGERIALMGNRGQSTGPHLHVEIWDANGAKVDPQSWLNRRGVRFRP